MGGLNVLFFGYHFCQGAGIFLLACLRQMLSICVQDPSVFLLIGRSPVAQNVLLRGGGGTVGRGN